MRSMSRVEYLGGYANHHASAALIQPYLPPRTHAAIWTAPHLRGTPLNIASPVVNHLPTTSPAPSLRVRESLCAAVRPAHHHAIAIHHHQPSHHRLPSPRHPRHMRDPSAPETTSLPQHLYCAYVVTSLSHLPFSPRLNSARSLRSVEN